jgi:5-methylthioribose kinase
MANELNEVLSQSVNYIKNGALNTRLSKELCDEMGSDNQNLVFHSEVRWLSRGEVLKRLYELRKEVEPFLIDKKSDLSHYFQDKKRVARLA